MTTSRLLGISIFNNNYEENTYKLKYTKEMNMTSRLVNISIFNNNYEENTYKL